jgi:hypothetical protein
MATNNRVKIEEVSDALCGDLAVAQARLRRLVEEPASFSTPTT